MATYNPVGGEVLFGKRERRLKARHFNKLNPQGHARAIPHVNLGGLEHKSCGKCGSLKPLDQFHYETKRSDGLSAKCKKCTSDYNKKKYKSRKDKLD